MHQQDSEYFRKKCYTLKIRSRMSGRKGVKTGRKTNSKISTVYFARNLKIKKRIRSLYTSVQNILNNEKKPIMYIYKYYPRYFPIKHSLKTNSNGIILPFYVLYATLLYPVICTCIINYNNSLVEYVRVSGSHFKLN